MVNRVICLQIGGVDFKSGDSNAFSRFFDNRTNLPSACLFLVSAAISYIRREN